jgi:hypothetical protein
VDVGGYGLCWQPTVVVVNPYWQPYYNCGHWIYSNCGWYWHSTYTWGWAPFHYGSWFRHANLGWCWVPGHVWAPSWVSWRYNDHYCGWAPLPPGAVFTAGVGVTFHGHYVGEREDFGLRPDHYHFVAWDHFHDRQLPPSGLSPSQKERVFASSTVSTRITGDNQTVINNGLPVSRVAAATHQPIHTVTLRDVNSPVITGNRVQQLESGGRVLSVYRPSPQQGAVPGSPWAPRPGATGRRSSNNSSGGTAPLVIRGPQAAALHETAPPHSLVVIGQRAASQPSALSAPSARPAPSAMQGETSSPQPTQEQNLWTRQAPNQTQQRSWMGTISSSPQPAWFAGSGSQVQNQFNGAVAAPRPDARSYQTAPRMNSPEVPRYAPSPSYNVQRSYSAPAPQVPMRAPSYEAPRSAPSAPPAPMAAPAAHSSSTQTPNRGGGR